MVSGAIWAFCPMNDRCLAGRSMRLTTPDRMLDVKGAWEVDSIATPASTANETPMGTDLVPVYREERGFL